MVYTVDYSAMRKKGNPAIFNNLDGPSRHIHYMLKLKKSNSETEQSGGPQSLGKGGNGEILVKGYKLTVIRSIVQYGDYW